MRTEPPSKLPNKAPRPRPRHDPPTPFSRQSDQKRAGWRPQKNNNSCRKRSQKGLGLLCGDPIFTPPANRPQSSAKAGLGLVCGDPILSAKYRPTNRPQYFPKSPKCLKFDPQNDDLWERSRAREETLALGGGRGVGSGLRRRSEGSRWHATAQARDPG